MGFRCRKPATKPLLNRKHNLKRLQRANMHKDCTEMHKNGQKSFLATNPSCASNLVIDDRGALLWRTEDERCNPACLKRSVKFPTSVMVWGCVSIRGMGKNIVFLKSTVTYTPYCVYGSVRESPCFIHRGSVWHLYGNEDMIFQQRLVTAHFSRSCTRKRSRHGYGSGAFKCSIGQSTVPT